MSASKNSIINKAVILNGGSPVSGDDGSDEWEISNTFYDDVYENLLRHMPWTFAREYLTLNLTDEESPIGYKYIYQIPNTVITVMDINSYNSFKLVGKNKLHTDDKDGVARCIVKVDENKLPADFVKALEYLLAAEIAIPLFEDSNRAKAYEDKAYKQIQRAIDNDLAQEPADSLVDYNTIYAAHFGSSGFGGYYA